MKYRLLLLMATLSLLSACATSTPPPEDKSLMSMTEKNLPAFQKVNINGPFAVRLDHDTNRYRLNASGNPEILNNTTVVIRDGTLTINTHKAYSKTDDNATLIIYAPYLQGISTQNTKQLYLEKTGEADLVISANSGEVSNTDAMGDRVTYDLSGTANLVIHCLNTEDVTINATGQNHIELPCMHVQHLSLNTSGTTSVIANGQARRLDLGLGGKSSFYSTSMTSGHTKIQAKDNAHATMNNVDIGLMNVAATDQSQAYFQGRMKKLLTDTKGNADVTISQSNINQLETNSAEASGLELHNMSFDHYKLSAKDHAHVVVAGHARRLDANLEDQSKLNSMCLYSRTLFVDTANDAQAKVRNYYGLSALASGHSTIYYYQDPKMVAEYLRKSGSVLRMNGLVQLHC